MKTYWQLLGAASLGSCVHSAATRKIMSVPVLEVQDTPFDSDNVVLYRYLTEVGLETRCVPPDTLM